MKVKALAAAIMMVGLTACDGVNLGDLSSTSDSAASVQDTASQGYYPNDQLIVSAKNQFREGNYGRANRLFQEAIEVAPADPQAWLGYAATSDLLRRFDKSDYAYGKLQPIIGNRVEFLNNFGYSHLLRGNLTTARSYFLRAYEIDPSNPVTANNLELLRNSVNYQRRAPGDLRGL